MKSLSNLLAFIAQHPDVIVRPCSTLDAVYLASPCVEADGALSSDLSPALRSFREVREWLGY